MAKSILHVKLIESKDVRFKKCLGLEILIDSRLDSFMDPFIFIGYLMDNFKQCFFKDYRNLLFLLSLDEEKQEVLTQNELWEAFCNNFRDC